MYVIRVSPLTGDTNALDLPITEEQVTRYNNGQLVQIAFPNLSADEREFIITGLLPGEFEAYLGLEE